MKQKTDWNWKISGWIASAVRRPFWTLLKAGFIILLIYFLFHFLG